MSTCVNYWSYTHKTIRHQMYDGYGPSSQGDAMLGWRQLADRLSSVRHYVDAAITGVQASQQGAAADAAIGAMTPLGAWVDEAMRLAIETGNRIDEQISAFTTAKGNIPQVPPEPRGWGWKDIPVIDSFTTSDQEIDEAFNQQQELQARAAMASYQDGTNTRLVNLTQFAAPPAGEPNLAIPTGERSAVGGFPGAGAPGGSGLPGSAAAPGSPTTLAGVAGAAPMIAPPAPTTPQSGTGVSGLEHPGARPAATVPSASAGVASGAPVFAGPVGGVPSRDGTRAGRPVQGSPAPQGLGSAGVGAHRAVRGFGPTGSPESAARGLSAGVAGASRVPGAGPSAATGGAAPFGAVGGGRSGDDKERRRPSYLVESDADRLIGDLPQTAPAVIGEDPSDDREPHRG